MFYLPLDKMMNNSSVQNLPQANQAIPELEQPIRSGRQGRGEGR